MPLSYGDVLLPALTAIGVIPGPNHSSSKVNRCSSPYRSTHTTKLSVRLKYHFNPSPLAHLISLITDISTHHIFRNLKTHDLHSGSKAVRTLVKKHTDLYTSRGR